VLSSRAHEPEGRPVALQRVREEEPDAAEGNRRRGARDVLLVGEKQEILPQFLLGDVIGTPVIMLRQLAHSRDGAALRPCGGPRSCISSSIRCRRRVMTISLCAGLNRRGVVNERVIR
jgi:hypothetical protein